MMTSVHTITLTCDNNNPDHPWGIFPVTYTGETEADCKRKAREEGWVFHHSNKQSCPACTRDHNPELRS